METKKLIGYGAFGVGIVLFAFSYASLRTWLGITIPASLKDLYFMIAGVVLIIGGAYFSFNPSSAKQAAEEVPIYHGKKIVGYRREKR